MSTPWIIAKENKDKSIQAIACRHDGYLKDLRPIVKQITEDEMDQILSIPYNEISRLYTKDEMEDLVEFYKEYNIKYSSDDFIEISSDCFAHTYNEESLKQIHHTKKNTRYVDREDLIKNGGYLEDWHIIFLLDAEGKWHYRKWDRDKFVML